MAAFGQALFKGQNRVRAKAGLRSGEASRLNPSAPAHAMRPRGRGRAVAYPVEIPMLFSQPFRQFSPPLNRVQVSRLTTYTILP